MESNSVEAKLTADDWQQRYEKGETGWDRGAPNSAMLDWLRAGLLQPGRLLAPGCGRGHEVIELARRGFDVTAVDFASAPLQYLQRRLEAEGLQANLVQADVFEFTAHHAFDVIYEQTCLCALHPCRWADYEARLRRWLKPGGALCALFMQSKSPTGPPFGCDIKTMQALFAPSHWEWPATLERFSHPAGIHELGGVLRAKAPANPATRANTG